MCESLEVLADTREDELGRHIAVVIEVFHQELEYVDKNIVWQRMDPVIQETLLQPSLKRHELAFARKR